MASRYRIVFAAAACASVICHGQPPRPCRRLSNDTAHVLITELRGEYYTPSSLNWSNQVAGAANGSVPVTVDATYNASAGTFHFTNSDVISVPLPTSASAYPSVSYEAWVKVGSAPNSLSWIVSQYPDYGWSRAVTLLDSRMGAGPGITPGGFDYGHNQVPIGTWTHVVGAWTPASDGTSNIYVNGVAGTARAVNNGDGASAGQLLVIGGRGPGDSRHNLRDLYIGGVRVYEVGSALPLSLHTYDWGATDTTSLSLMVPGTGTPE
eukprot:COSAG01_NODE_2663_length_7293_cov_5.946483_3_plen_265_part_00